MRRFLTHPLTLAATSILCFLIFMVIIVLTYGPVFVVEAKYQYRKVMEEVFHAKDLRSLILPTINTDWIGVNNQEFGMQVPKIYLDEPIVFNVDPHNSEEYSVALKKGIAHAAGTDLPPYDGLGYYFAHSSNPELKSQYNAVFYLLGKLEKEDTVNIWFEKKKYEYVVIDKVVTNPDDVSFLNRSYELPTIVLQTCWPPGTTQKRLLIFAERKQL
jgi:LPXTG-site transpeptidase (sortase) family protein